MCLEHYGVFSRYVPERLSLKCKIVLKGIPSGETGVDPEWVEELQWEKAIGF